MSGFIKLKDLPIKTKIKFGKYQVENETPHDIIWEIADKNYYSPSFSTSGKFTVTLTTAEVEDIRFFDWSEKNRTSGKFAKETGFWDYSVSNINQWLNSDKAGNIWYTPQHDQDYPPNGEYLSTELNEGYSSLAYDDHPGFLYYFSEQEKNMMIPMYLNKIDSYPDVWQAYVTPKVYLMSTKEYTQAYGFSNFYAPSLNTLPPHDPLYGIECARYFTQECVDNTTYKPNSSSVLTKGHKAWWMTRTAYTADNDLFELTGVQHAGSGLAYTFARASSGVLPVTNLDPDTLISATTDSDGCYTILSDQTQPIHEHNWATDWSYNETHHWHECLTENCPNTENAEKAGYAPHISSDWIITSEATDKIAGSKHKVCTVCGKELEVEEIPKLPGFDGKKLSTMPTGTKIKFGRYKIGSETAQDIIWEIIGINHSGYPSNSVTLMTEKIIDFRSFDGLEANSSNSTVKKYGLNDWSLCNLRQWLNSDKSSGWYSSQHSADAPPTDANCDTAGSGYSTKSGFLNLFTSEEKEMLLTTQLQTQIYSLTNGSKTSVTTSDKIFIPSAKEIGYSGTTVSYSDGVAFSGFPKPKLCTQQAFTYGSSSKKPSTVNDYAYYRNRTGNTVATTFSATASSGKPGTNTTTYYRPYTSLGITPMCNLNGNCQISDTPDSDGCYIIQPPQPHVHTWATIWSTNETAHWHNCLISDCDITDITQKDGYGLHQASEWEVIKEPTYTETGSRRKVCTVCGYVMEEEEMPVLKIPETMTVEITNPIWTDKMITEIYVSTFEKGEMDYVDTILFCNNAFDINPTWEDVTENVLEKEVINLTNTTKTADNWGISFKITMTKSEPIPDKQITLNCFGISYR